MVGTFNSGPGSFELTSFEIPGNPFTDFPVFEYDGGFEFSELTQPFRAVTAEVNAVSDRPSALRGRVFPNPVQNVLTLEWPESLEDGHVEVWTAWGQLCSTHAMGRQDRLDIPTSSWALGVYTVRAHTHLGTEPWRILKQ